jgi:PAS domain S-box-containing protein
MKNPRPQGFERAAGLKLRLAVASGALVVLSLLTLGLSAYEFRSIAALSSDLATQARHAEASKQLILTMTTQILTDRYDQGAINASLTQWEVIALGDADETAALQLIEAKLQRWSAGAGQERRIALDIFKDVVALGNRNLAEITSGSALANTILIRMRWQASLLLALIFLASCTIPWMLGRVQNAEERFLNIAETIDEIFFITSGAGDRMLYISPSYERLMGRSCESLYAEPRSWMENVIPEDKARVLAAYQVMAANGFHEQYRVKSASGETRWIEAHATPVRDASGQAVKITGLARDITPQKKAEEALLDSQKRLGQSQKLEAVGQLAAGVAHEINNPLGVILGYAQGLAKDIPSGSDIEFPLKSIEREAVRCRNLVQDLLTFSRASKADRQPLDLNRTVAGALSLVTAQARLARVAVNHELSPALPRVLGNANQIQQVVVNLASNALDAMPRGGALTVKTSLIEENALSWVGLTLEDTGAGIPIEIQGRVFEPFFTTKEPGKGTGLGLSLVHEIVKKHSGSIVVESRPGRTIFRIKLPVRTGFEAAS